MLSKFLDITIIIWIVDDSGTIISADRYGGNRPSQAYNLCMIGNAHFDSMHIRVFERLETANLSLIGRLESIEELASLEEVPFLLPREEDHQSNYGAKKRELSKLEVRAIENSQGIPLRIGRIVELLFSCRLGFSINHRSLRITILDDSKYDVFDIRKLGHHLLTNDRKMKREYSKCSLEIDNDVWPHLDESYLLRFAFPGYGLHRFIPMLLPAFIEDVLKVCLSVLLSSFLYKSKVKYKREFIINCCRSTVTSGKRVFKSIKNTTTSNLYTAPQLVLRSCCEHLYGRLIVKITSSIKAMSGESHLLLRNLDFSSLSLADYLKLLTALAKEDLQDQSFINKELISLNKLNKTLKEIKDDGRWETKEKEEVISKFFEEKNMLKFIGKSGKASGSFQIGNVLAYAHNLYLNKDSLGLASDDMEQISIEIRKLQLLQEGETFDPVAIICNKLEGHFNKAFCKLPKICQSECHVLFDDIRNSSNHAAAWKHALRLKGTMYEGFFSQHNNWKYIPEDLKPSLMMAIQTLFPEKFVRFLEKTQLHPEFRDLVPDFLITQRLLMEGDNPKVNISHQLKVIEGLQESVESIPMEDQRIFPLPEVAVSEVRSIEGILNRMETQARQSNSKQNRFHAETNNVVLDQERSYSTHQLLFVEVGYQTDVEGKVLTDTAKWKEVLKLLAILDIKATLLVCVDNSKTHVNDWWIDEESVRLLKGSISHLFSKLSKNTPMEVTDIVVGSISTQKIRSFLKSGTSTKTPLSTKDVQETWHAMKDYILNRETGVQLGEKYANPIYIGLVEGVTMTDEGVQLIMNLLKDNMKTLTDEFEKTKYKHEINKSIETGSKMVLAWLKEDLEGCRCTKCISEVFTSVNDVAAVGSKLSILARACSLSSHPVCCHSETINVANHSNFQKRTPDLSSINHLSVRSLDDDEGSITDLDKLIRLTLPGKTEKEKKVKRSVDCLIKLMMFKSSINCIKLPSGQIVMLDKTTKSNIVKSHDPSLNGKANKFTTSREETVLKNLSNQKLSNYSDYVKQVINSSIKNMASQQASNCKLNDLWVEKLINDLDVPLQNEEVIEKIKKSVEQRKKYTRNNDKLIIRSTHEIISYLTNFRGSLCAEPNNRLFSVDCVLFKEVVSEAMLRYQSTAYQGCVDHMLKLLELLLEFTWFQEVLVYSKICETFLRICTEFNRAGLKLLKVRHLNINIAVKLPANKKQNMQCRIYDCNMQHLTDVFFLNRRQAIIGAAYPYILLVLYIQVLQQQRCIEELDNRSSHVQGIRNKSDKLLTCFMNEAASVLNGHFEEAYKERFQMCKLSGNFSTKPPHENFINVFAGLNLVYGVIMRDSFLANSQPQNKQLQMLRYGMLNGLSRLSCPLELGKKFSSSCRRIEDNLSRVYLQSTVYCSMRDVEKNISAWKEVDLCPSVTIPCFSIYGLFVNSDRQLIFDIYNVHIYNKEMDNFDEGCISVLEETADRHMNWELDLEKSWRNDHDQRSTRLLLGIPNVHRSKCQDSKKIEDSRSDISSLKDSCLTRRSSSSNKSSTSSLINRYTTIIKPIEIDSGIFLESDTLRQGRASATGGPKYYAYTPNKASVLKDCMTIINKNPNYTFGSFEVIQAVTEFARNKYPQENICKAKRDPKNWVSISEVTETTSIVATPKTEFYVKDCFKTNISNQNKKLSKMIKNKFKKLGSLFSDSDISKKDCTVLLSTVDGLTAKQKQDITNAVFEPSKLSLYNWSYILTKGVFDVLLTHDGNIIYCWIKSLSLMAKSRLRKHLSFMSVGNDTVPEEGFFSSNEIESLITIRRLLICEEHEEISTVCASNLVSAWIKCIFVKPIEDVYNDKLLLDMLSAAEELYTLRLKHMILIRDKKENSYTSFIKEELILKGEERVFLNNYDKLIVKSVNFLLFAAVSAPWCMHYKALESYIVKHPEILDIGDTETYSNSILSLTLSNVVYELYKIYCGKRKEVVDKRKMISLRFFVRYLTTMFASNSEPFSTSLNEDEIDVGKTSDVEERLLSQTKLVFTKLGLGDKNYDFIWTVQMIANSNFNVCKKLTGRSEGERLPRSIRSKVVYEMVKLVGESGMAILQQLAFAKSLNYNHRFFAVLAPKAQLGGSRDLLVQETGTKIIHAATESFSRSLLRTTNDDGLTNQNLKETVLNHALDSLTTMRNVDGELLKGSSNLIQFYKVICISGDNTKWGPIHCCSFFSGMMQQLLKDHPDWSAFYRLTFVKNLCRQIEIPAASIKKIINVAKLRMEHNQDIDSLSEEQAQDLLKKSADEWSALPYVKFLIKTYLRKGKLAMNSYNHMGQGIHHATSSILTSIMAETFEELCTHYFKSIFPNLTVDINHAGSSDDYAKTIIVTGVLDREQYELYDSIFWNHACRFKNYIAAVNRCCQMKDSAKTLVGDCFLEFYSEFMMGYRVTPAVIKFIFTGLMNSSVTSPSSLTQACHVSSQQAMYNSVPMLTNITFTLCRQQMFFNHVEGFIRKFGPITLGSVSQFGRLYCPRYSNLVNTSVTIEDCESIVSACNSILKWDDLFETLAKSEIEEEFEKDRSKKSLNSSETSSFKSGESSTEFSFIHRRSLTDDELKFIDISSECARYTDAQAVEERLGLYYWNTRDQNPKNKDFILNSTLCNSCEWIKRGKDKCALEAIVRIQMLLKLLCFGHYRSFSGQGLERQVKSSLNRDENQIIEDPMIQLIPEKLRRELERLGLSKMSVEELLPKSLSCSSICQVVAHRLISLNVSTESYIAEVSRLKQTLTARNVLFGLAGGVKELSIPIYTIFMKSYFFKDNVFLDLTDRWLTQHSANYRDSSGKKLDGKIVTKYPHWLSVFMNCLVSMDSTSELTDKSLFNDSLRCVGVTRNSNNQRMLTIIKSHLESVSSELKYFILQFSNLNRRKMRIVESRPAECEMEANKVVITKSSLFTAGDGVKLNNNPAVVIGFLLDESSISEIKPSRVDFANLMKDKFKLSQYFPSVDLVLKSLKRESDQHLQVCSTPDYSVSTKYVNYLTLLCRMMIQTNSSLTVFYMIKSNKLRNEPTVSDLISYGIKEGRYLKLPEAAIDTSTYSVKYWKIIQCISCIGLLPLSDSSRRDILFGFMNWKVTCCGDLGCPIFKEEASVLSEFNNQTILHVLASEVHLIKDRHERESIVNLVDYVTSPSELIKKKPYLGTTASFRTWGGGGREGRFTYSSRSGESTGIFVGGKLHVYLSNDTISLLDEVERNVLGWLSQRRTEIFTIEQHESFVNLLPSMAEFGSKSSDGKIVSVTVDKSNPRFLRYTEPKGSAKNHILRIKKQILTVKKISTMEFESDPKLVWSKSGVSIVFDEISTEVTYHERIGIIKNLLANVVENKTLPSLYQDTQVCLSKLRFSDTILMNSIALLHAYLVHAPLDAFNNVGSKKTVLKTFLENRLLVQSEGQTIEQAFGTADLHFHKQTPHNSEAMTLLAISKTLTESMLPFDSWPEVQAQLETCGLSNFLLTFKPEPAKGYLMWDLQTSFVSDRLKLLDIKDVVSSVNSGVLVPAFLPFLFEPALLKELTNISLAALHTLSSLSITNEQVDRIVITTIYCFQTDPRERNSLKFRPSSLLGLCQRQTFRIGNRLDVSAVADFDEVSLVITIRCTDPQDQSMPRDKKQLRIIKNFNSSVRCLMIDQCVDIKKIKENFNDLSMESDHKGTKIKFTAKPHDNNQFDYLALMYEGKERLAEYTSIANFVLFLLGCKYSRFEEPSTVKVEEDISIDSIIDAVETINVQVSQDEPVKFPDKVYFSDDDY
uniref:RNA-directed RNA polymerase L n=2 Tax=Erve virus TaxID=248062 RepID=A0A191KW95_9VIRU|nr:RNA-dependent RNA polymerase [Erve virus]